MKLFFDENISQHLARGMHELQRGRPNEGFEVSHIVEAMGKRGAPDEEWIPHVAQTHGVVITQDFEIHRTRHLAELCKQYKLGVFFFRPPKGNPYGYWKIIKWVLESWGEIKSNSLDTELPFEFEVTPRGGVRRI